MINLLLKESVVFALALYNRRRKIKTHAATAYIGAALINSR